MHTWDPQGGSAISVDAMATQVIEHIDAGLDGVTFSGGEPLQQIDALGELLVRIDSHRKRTGASFDVLIYSGYTPRQVESKFVPLLAGVDAIVAGPFQQSRPSDDHRWGSANQRVITLSALGEERYSSARPSTAHLQVEVSDGQLTVVGVPRRGDLDRMQAAVEAQGVRIGDVTWR